MNGLLLDTHAALFWWGGSPNLGQAARDAIVDPATDVYVSAASAWEIATKYRIGKLGEIGDPLIEYPRLMAMHGFKAFDIAQEHSLRAGSMDGKHRDPFDRLIAAQALIEDLTVVTRDPEIAAFGCKVLW